MEINQRVFQALSERRIEQKELADFLEIPPGTVFNWRSRGTDPPAKYIPAISRFFDVPIEWLLTGEDPPAAPKMTAEELELWGEFNKLDVKGKRIVFSEIYKQQERMKEEFAPELASDPKIKTG